MTDAEVALPDMRFTADPTATPPLAQGLTPTAQRKNSTVPVGVGPLPVTVTVSLFDAPRTIDAEVGEVTVDEGAFVTVKHSPKLASLDGR